MEAENNTMSEVKSEELPDNSTTEDAPTGLETVPEGTAVRDEILQTTPKDKAKSNLIFRFIFKSMRL